MTAPHHVIHIILFFTFFFLCKRQPAIDKERQHNNWTFFLSFVPRAFAQRRARDNTAKGGKVHYSSKKAKKNFARCSYRGAASIHQRHSLRVRRAPAAPGAPLLHLRAAPLVLCLLPLPISKLTQSSSREDGGGRKVRKRRRCVARKF